MASSPEAARLKAACEAQWQAPGLANVDRRTVWTGSAAALQAKPGAATPTHDAPSVRAFVARVRAHWGPAAPAYVGRQQIGPEKAK